MAYFIKVKLLQYMDDPVMMVGLTFCGGPSDTTSARKFEAHAVVYTRKLEAHVGENSRGARIWI